MHPTVYHLEHDQRSWRGAVLVVILGLMASMFAFAGPTRAADTTIVVSPSNLNGWSYDNLGTTASQSFVVGPGTPPAGTGSAAFTHSGPPGANGGLLKTAAFDGTYLRDITELRYWTYQEGADALLFQPPYVQVFLDLDDDGTWDDGIGFEPSWQTGGRFMVTSLQGTSLSPANTINVEQNGLGSTGAGVAANQWWEWDLLIGSWWGRGGPLSSGSGPADQLGVGECNQFTGGCATIAGIVEAYPNARIISRPTLNDGIRLIYGFGGNSDEYIGHIDKVVLGSASGATTYDFEPTAASESLSPGTTICDGTYSGTGKDVTVPTGATCTLENATVTNNVKVQQGGTLILDGTVVGHDVKADKAAAVTICDAEIDHDLSVTNTSGDVVIGGSLECANTIGHNLNVKNNAGSVTVSYNDVGRDANCKPVPAGSNNTAGHKNSCPI